MKKKSPPYAIICAVLLGLACIGALIKWKQAEDQKQADAIKAQQAADAAAMEAFKNSQPPPVAEHDVNSRNVLYATQPVQPGTRISPAFFEKKLTPNNILPDAYTEADNDAVVGSYATRTIEKGDPLTPRNVGKSLPYMSQRIDPGMRALSLPVFNADLNDTGGFIVDGDKVDLLFTTMSADGGTAFNTGLVMQNLDVLYVPGPAVKTDKTDGITPVPPPGDAISVTFQVTPEQAQALVFMTQIKGGHFSMILRARKDDSVIKIKPFAYSDYQGDYHTLQSKIVDKSMARVQELAAKILAAEKTQGTTNETPNPTPPSP